jgi:hypothetical protein
MGLITLIAFWCLAIRLWMIDGPKIPLIFMPIWLVALFAVPALGWPGFVSWTRPVRSGGFRCTGCGRFGGIARSSGVGQVEVAGR